MHCTSCPNSCAKCAQQYDEVRLSLVILDTPQITGPLLSTARRTVHLPSCSDTTGMHAQCVLQSWLACAGGAVPVWTCLRTPAMPKQGAYSEHLPQSGQARLAFSPRSCEVEPTICFTLPCKRSALRQFGASLVQCVARSPQSIFLQRHLCALTRNQLAARTSTLCMSMHGRKPAAACTAAACCGRPSTSGAAGRTFSTAAGARPCVCKPCLCWPLLHSLPVTMDTFSLTHTRFKSQRKK